MIFYKYQGTGNDFVIVNNMKRKISLSTSDIKWMCDRKFGVGSDGLIIIEPHPEYDFNMLFYNPDGSRSFCGNGSRCAVAFARDHHLIADSCSFMAIDGLHEGKFEGEEVLISIRQPSELNRYDERSCFIHTGSPHHISYTDDLETEEFEALASVIRYSEKYQPSGSNVNFVKDLGEHRLRMRTYERGVEAETLSCGSGVTAAALAHHQRYDAPSGEFVTEVNTKGGKLSVHFNFVNGSYTNIWLKGPARQVYKGEISILQKED